MSAPATFKVASLYLVGFAQAQAPHVGLIIPTSTTTGRMVHIRIDRDTSPYWVYQERKQNIAGDMAMSTLLEIHDFLEGEITVDKLRDAAQSVPVPQNDTFGECRPWVTKVVIRLAEMGLVRLEDSGALEMEFTEFAVQNRAYAMRSRFPNTKTSAYCH